MCEKKKNVDNKKVIAYQWWLSQVDVLMAELYGKNQAVS